MPDSSETAGTPGPSGRRLPWIVLLAALAAGALFSFIRLDRPVLWSDEADTALFARNLLRFGNLTAWDGQNVFAFAGGLDLNEDLVNDYLPPQQYYLAALGLKLFGDSAAAARAPFAALGLLTIGIVAWWSRQYFGRANAFAWSLPALLLVLSPSFLPFMRNARYYAPGAFWTVLLLALWSLVPALPRDAKHPRLRSAGIHVLAAIATLGLFNCQYLYGAAALAVLPVFLLDPRFRTRAQVLLLGTVYAVGFLYTLKVVLTGAATDTLLDRREEFGGFFGHWIRLSWWTIRDLGVFEFFAWPLVLPLALPWMLTKLASSRALARKGLVLLAALLVHIVAVSFLSPQTFHGTNFADMRYVIPLIPVGAAVTAASLVILWRAQKGIAIACALALVTTNVLYPGAHREQKRSAFGVETARIRSTLLDRLGEFRHPPVSTAEKVRQIVRGYSPGSRVWLSPAPLATTTMFYLPHYRYCGLLTKEKPLRADLAATLSGDLFLETASPDVIVMVVTKLIMREGGYLEYEMIQPEAKGSIDKWLTSGEYRTVSVLPIYGFDETRPDIPLHLFREPPPEAKNYFSLWILERK